MQFTNRNIFIVAVVVTIIYAAMLLITAYLTNNLIEI